jgi:hypothetical protein
MCENGKLEPVIDRDRLFKLVDEISNKKLDLEVGSYRDAATIQSQANHIAALIKKVDRLESAIKEHAANFPDEPLSGEVKLWKTVGIEVSTFHGRFQNPNRQ